MIEPHQWCGEHSEPHRKTTNAHESWLVLIRVPLTGRTGLMCLTCPTRTIR